MKELLKIALFFALLTLLIPLLVFAFDREEKAPASPPQNTAVSENTVVSDVMTDDKFIVLNCGTGKLLEMTMYEYVKGAVLGEMPASYDIEALKAQAVAAHTYAVRRKNIQLSSPDVELKGAYISDDSTKYQAFFTPEQAKAFYEDKYEEYDRRVSEAVKSVENEILTYNGEPAIAAFHALSSGRTESAEVVWGSAVPYLIPVESEYDLSAPDFKEEKLFTAAEIRSLLEENGFDASEECGEWFGSTRRSASGTVISQELCGEKLSGAEIRTMLGLRSACYTEEYDGLAKQFTFTVSGNGHGVGMSQYGAAKMAENGCDYREILAHYYPSAELTILE